MGDFLSPTSVITDRALHTRIQVWRQLSGRSHANDGKDQDAETETACDKCQVGSGNKECYALELEATSTDDVLLLAIESTQIVSRNTPAA